MAHAKVVDRWEEGKSTPIPPDAKIRAHAGGEKDDRFFATVCVDDYSLIKVQHSDDDATVLIASDSLASDHVRLFGQGEEGVTPILAPQEEQRLGHHDRCPRVHYQLAHYKNLVSKKETKSTR